MSDEPAFESVSDAEPAPVPNGATRYAVATFGQFWGVPDGTYVVSWDDTRGAVRTVQGVLQHYEDGRQTIFTSGGRLRSARANARRASTPDHPYFAALAVRSLLDLSEVIDLDDPVVTASSSGGLRLASTEDDAQADVKLDPVSGVVLTAKGTAARAAWYFNVLRSGLLLDDQSLLAPTHISALPWAND